MDYLHKANILITGSVLDDVVLRIVTEAYDAYEQYGHKEPVVTVQAVWEDIEQRHSEIVSEEYYLKPKKKQLLEVRRSLDRLVRKGVLEVSLALGYSGRETKAYNPV